MSTVIEEIVKLQTASAEQTSASQALSQEVAGKMSAIDLKVLEAEQRTDTAIANVNAAIPTAVNDELSQTLYLDATNGNDANDGTQSKPFRTLKALIDSIPTGSSVQIKGNANQVINIDNTISQTNKHVLVLIDNLTINASASYKVYGGSLRFPRYLDVNQLVDYFIHPYSANVYVMGVDVVPNDSKGFIISGHAGNHFGNSISMVQIGGSGASSFANAANPYYLFSVSSYDLCILTLTRNIQLGTNISMYGSKLQSLQVGTSPVYLIGA